MANPPRGTLIAMPDFSEVRQSFTLVDNRGRTMRFPNRHDYLDFLVSKGLIEHRQEFVDVPELVKAVYLDWLRRAQIGCVFAQLLGRHTNRKGMRTEVIGGSHNARQISDLAEEIDSAVQDAVDKPNAEAISILLPTLLDAEDLVRLILALSVLPKWIIEREWQWRGTLTVVGLRREIDDKVLAETLGLGPFPFLPPTRQGPITSLEIRTKPLRSIWSKLQRRRTRRAAHLAQIPTADFLTPKEHRVRFNQWTPALKKRILGGNPDERAKASVTFAVPAAIWSALRSHRS